MCTIDDFPRFSWRGLLVDVARHFVSLETLQRVMDGMSLCKLNVLHLHLTDDQAFRFPSRRLPVPEPRQYGPEELRELVAYGAQRGIRVVPEIDVPGHCTALLVAHPRLGTGQAQPTTRFGPHPGCLDPTRELVFEALDELFAEVAEIFPDRFVHIGGDEVDPGWWQADADVAQFMRAHELMDVAALQAHFMNRIAAQLRKLEKQPIGWDETLHPTLAQGVTVQSWRGATARNRTLASGHDCIVSAPYYLDLNMPADVHYRFDPEAPEAALQELEDELLHDPRLLHVADGMRWTQQWRDQPALPLTARPGQVLGGEACLWAELVTEQLLVLRLWPRLAAVAERLWSAAEVRCVSSFEARGAVWLQALSAATGIDVHAQFHERMAAAGVPDSWLPLVELLEPVKWYARLLGAQALQARLMGREMPQARPYDTSSTLDGIVDGLPPESLRSAELRGLCRSVAGDAGAAQILLDMARGWQQLVTQDDCPQELLASAAQLGSVAEVLEAYLQQEMSRAAACRALAALNVPQGELVLAVTPLLYGWLQEQTG